MEATFDIASEAVADASTIHVKSAAGEPLYADAARTKPVEIVVYGPGSSAYGVVESRQSARAVKRMQDNDGKITVAPFEDRVRETAEDLAEITVRFNNFVYSGAPGAEGKPPFAAVYADQKIGFVAKQVTKFLADWGNFKAASVAN